MTQFRIYYGALEQANHFVKPAVEAAAGGAHIDLVRLGRYCANDEKTAISAILEWKEPDILVTAIRSTRASGDVEEPLFTIEFSTAAFTKDHELQRFDNYVPLMIDRFVPIKISPTRKRAGDHGGDTDYDYLVPLALVQNRLKITPYHFEWRVDATMSRVLLDKTYLSCPPQITEFNNIVARAVSEYERGVDGWIERLHDAVPSLLSWRKRLASVGPEDVTALNSTRTAYKNGSLELKINRMGHAMDPERGMLCYYGLLPNPVTAILVFDGAKKAWYDGATQREKIKSYVEKSGMQRPLDYAMCFAMGTNIDASFKPILEKVRGGLTEICIDDFVSAHYDTLSKALKTIFSFSDRLVLKNGAGEAMVTFKYARHVLRKKRRAYPPAPLTNGGITEDEITYLIVHDILRKNGFEILAVSYPAAQGDRVMLIEKNTGRTQKRDYIDIVFLTDANFHLHENKAEFSVNGVRKDVDKLRGYKAGKRRQIVDDFIDRYYEGPSKKEDVKGRCIRIGVGFVYDGSFKLSNAQFLDDLDYFVYIKKNMEWKVWQCGGDLDFTVHCGQAHLPKTHVLKRKRASRAQLPADP